ncbi:hypothetical protein WG66_005551 [Moniliophthora roreri]|nr:hypothetical protein WG66_005551 [Moniliophthora roreri]
MGLQRRSACVLPPEVIDIIIGFAKELPYVCDPNEVFRKEREEQEVGDKVNRREEKEKNKQQPISVLLALSLVCRAWLPWSRKHFFTQRVAIFDIEKKPDQVELFLEILSNEDRFPKLPTILSFIKLIRVHSPAIYSGDLRLLSNLLMEMSNRGTYFRPRRLTLNQEESLPPDVFQSLTSVFSTITNLWISSGFDLDAQISSDSAPPFRSFNPSMALTPEFITGQAFTYALHTVVFDFKGLPQSLPGENSHLKPFTQWLQQHPEAHNLRDLRLYWGSTIDSEFIQSFLNICPNLEDLWFRTTRDPCVNYPDDWIDASVFDLSSVPHLRRLMIDLVPLGDHRRGTGMYVLEAVGRILHTLKSSSILIGLRINVNDYTPLSMPDWWIFIDIAMSQLPDVTLAIYAVRPLSPDEGDDEEITRAIDAAISDAFGEVLPNTREQSKLRVFCEIAAFPDDDDDDQF